MLTSYKDGIRAALEMAKDHNAIEPSAGLQAVITQLESTLHFHPVTIGYRHLYKKEFGGCLEQITRSDKPEWHDNPRMMRATRTTRLHEERD